METKAVLPDKMLTLTESLDKAMQEGYTINLAVEGKRLTSTETVDKKFYTPDEVIIENFQRFEGASDPEDSSILYYIKANDGTKGTLVDAYGTYADSKVSDFIRGK